MEPFVWTLVGLMMFVGLAGVVIPLLPGTTLILVAAVLHKLLLPEWISWWTVALLAALWLVSVLVDFLGSVLAVKLGGGSRWGMAGAAAGGFAGLFISTPAILLGSILGAALAEKVLGRREPMDALKAGLAAGIGFLVSVFVRVILAFAMILAFVVACLRA